MPCNRSQENELIFVKLDITIKLFVKGFCIYFQNGSYCCFTCRKQQAMKQTVNSDLFLTLIHLIITVHIACLFEQSIYIAYLFT